MEFSRQYTGVGYHFFFRGLPDPRDLHLLNGSNRDEPDGVFVRNDTFILIKHLELPIAHECSMKIGPRGRLSYLCAFLYTDILICGSGLGKSRKIRTHDGCSKVTELFCFVF